MWQLQYMLALQVGAERIGESERDRLGRAARTAANGGPGRARRAIARVARRIADAARTVEGWAEPRGGLTTEA